MLKLMESEVNVAVAATMVVGGILMVLIIHLHCVLLLNPRKLRSKLEIQGIKGPPPSFMYGNIPDIKKIQLQLRSSSQEVAHDWPSSVFPHIEQWRKLYGPTFMYSTGNIQILCITDPELAKEVSLCTSLSLGKPSYLSKDRGPLLGQGILSSNGSYWAQQRKIIAPEFYPDKIKGMVNLITESVNVMLLSWERNIDSGEGYADIKIDNDLRSLSADIISRACFGSNYSKGEKIFLELRNLQKLMSRVNVGVPGQRYVPTKLNRAIWKLEKEIESMILKVVEARTEDHCAKDLLQMIVESAKSYDESHDGLPSEITPQKFIVDNCKSLYFAGHETTATSASWCLMLLAAYPDWQDRARMEVLNICGNNIPDADMLRSMKTVTMVIQETLRLYPPVAYLVREALEDIHLKGGGGGTIHIPKGTNIQILIPFLHQHPDLWGPDDVHLFNPHRFANGTASACKVPQAYMPFGAGTRTCLGQHFAMAELKLILAIILSRYRFSLSPQYHHSPAFRLLIEPGNGVDLCISRL